jgi:preprotein translocase subunit SecY
LSIFALGCDAVYFGLDHSAVDVDGGAVAGAVAQGRRRGRHAMLTRYTRYLTVSAGSSRDRRQHCLQNQMAGGTSVVVAPGVGFILTATISLVTGTVFLMWLGEQVTERGIGNGISMLIFAGIVAGLPHAVGGTLELARTGELHVMLVLFLLALTILVTGFVVFVERGQRRITVNYAKRQQGRRVYAAQTTHLPLKLNMSGVIPPIFASSLILFPATLGSWFGNMPHMEWLRRSVRRSRRGSRCMCLLYAGLIIFFCFFYTALVFNSKETADNLEKIRCIYSGYSTRGADSHLYR